MLDKVRKYIEDNKMLNKGDKVVVGVSGGADSTALLELLFLLREEYGLSLYVVHINHGIRPEASEDAEYVRELCEERKLPFYLFEEDIPAMAEREHLSEEEAGRYFRYRCFYKVMCENGADKLAVAHHMDDQAETVLFHLARGTDLAGLAGMQPVSGMPVELYAGEAYDFTCHELNKNLTLIRRPGNDGLVKSAPEMDVCDKANDSIRIIRPLLGIRRQEITKWLENRGMSWQEDATNGDDNYARNRIRNRVIKDLSAVNEKASEHIAEFAGRAAEYDGYIRRQALSFIESEAVLLNGSGENIRFRDGMLMDSLNVDGSDKGNLMYKENLSGIHGIKVKREQLLSKDRVLSDRVLYEMLIMMAGAKKDITREHVDALYDLLSKQSGRELNLPYKVRAVISYDWLILEMAGVTAENGVGIADGVEIDINDLKYQDNISIKISDTEKIVLRLIDIQADDESFINKMKKFFGKEEKNYTKYFDCDTIDNTLYIRYPVSGDYLICDRDGHSKKLSKHFKDVKLPADERKTKSLLACGSEVLWVLGDRRCEAHLVTRNTTEVLEVEYISEGDAQHF